MLRPPPVPAPITEADEIEMGRRVFVLLGRAVECGERARFWPDVAQTTMTLNLAVAYRLLMDTVETPRATDPPPVAAGQWQVRDDPYRTNECSAWPPEGTT